MKNETRAIIDSALAIENIPAEERQRILDSLSAGSPRHWITERQAAELLGITPQLLNRWRRRGTYAGHQFPFAVWYPPMLETLSARYDRAEIITYIETHLNKGRPSAPNKETQS